LELSIRAEKQIQSIFRHYFKSPKPCFEVDKISMISKFYKIYFKSNSNHFETNLIPVLWSGFILVSKWFYTGFKVVLKILFRGCFSLAWKHNLGLLFQWKNKVGVFIKLTTG